MKPLELIFALLAKFIDFPAGRLSDLKKQAATWQDEQMSEDKKGTIFNRVLSFFDAWYMQVLLAVVFLFGVKSIGRWLMSDDQADMLEDDDIDDAPASGKKFQLPV